MDDWSSVDAERFELAREGLSLLIADAARRHSSAIKSKSNDSVLETQKRWDSLLEIKKNLKLNDHVGVNKVLDEWGPEVKKLVRSHG